MKNKIKKKEILTKKNILQVKLNNEFAVFCKVCTNFQLSNEAQNQEKGNINKKEHFTSETKQWICRIFVKSVQTSNCQMKHKITKKEILTKMYKPRRKH